MSSRFTVLFVLWCCLLSCDKNTAALPPVMQEGCPLGADYGLDFSSVPALQDRRIWLVDEDQEIAADRVIDPTTSGVQFINFPNACEEEYSVNIASFLQQTSIRIYEQDLRQSLSILEVAQVPTGTTVDRVHTFEASWGYPENEVLIYNCPPIAEAKLEVKREGSAFYPLTNLVDAFSYTEEDSLLTLDMDHDLLLQDESGILLLQTTDGEWFGLAQDFRTNLPGSLTFSDFEPYVPKDIQLLYPAATASSRAELLWIADLADKRFIRLGELVDDDQFAVLVPASGPTPLLLHLLWRPGGGTYESQQVFTDLPQTVEATSSIEVFGPSLAYPFLSYTAEDAQIVSAYKEQSSPGRHFERRYVGPSGTGVQFIRFAPFSPGLEEVSGTVTALYHDSFSSNVKLSLYNYPALEGGYRWYLRNVLSDLATGEAWLRSLEYTCLTVNAN